MPASSAAWSTVVPFGTDRAWPSIVTLTLSMISNDITRPTADGLTVKMPSAAWSRLTSTRRRDPLSGTRTTVRRSVSFTRTFATELVPDSTVTVTGTSYTSPVCSNSTTASFAPPRSSTREDTVTWGSLVAEHPPVEEARETHAGLLLHGAPKIVGARLLEPPRVVEAPEAGEERLVADEPPQHVQHHGALVVDHGPVQPAVALDVADAVAEVDRALVRLVVAHVCIRRMIASNVSLPRARSA